MTPFDYMVQCVAPATASPRVARPMPAEGAAGACAVKARKDGPTEALRAALQAGAMGTRELAAASGVEPRLIRALLKADIDSGRVRIRLDGRRHGVYELSVDFDDELRTQLAAARRLLTRHGYRVSRRKTHDER